MEDGSMYTQIQKPKETKDRAAADSIAQKNSSLKQCFGFMNHRPDAIAQRELTQMIRGGIEHLDDLNKVDRVRSTIQLMNFKRYSGFIGIFNFSSYTVEEKTINRLEFEAVKEFETIYDRAFDNPVFMDAIGNLKAKLIDVRLKIWGTENYDSVEKILKEIIHESKEIFQKYQSTCLLIKDIVTLIQSDSAVENITWKLTSRDWYKNERETWEMKLNKFKLVVMSLEGEEYKSKFAGVVYELSCHAGKEPNTVLGTLKLTQPEKVPETAMADATPAEVLNGIKTLDKQMKTKKRIRQFGNLDRIEKKITAWFSRHKTNLLHPDRKKMFEYLNNVQRLHKELTAWQIENKGQLWMTGPLNKNDGKIQEIWQTIMDGSGQFTFKQSDDESFGKKVNIPSEVTQTIKIEIISQLGRLMSRPAGRRLIGAFFKTETVGVVNFKLAQLYRIVHDKYVGDSAVARPDGRKSFSGGLHMAQEGKVRRGQGQGSDIMVTPNKPDSLFLDYDKNYNRILSPGFIGLGHELIHAAHTLNGISVGDWKLKEMPPEYHDLEEFITIAPKSELRKYSNYTIKGYAYADDGKTEERVTSFKKLLELIDDTPTEADLRQEHALDSRYEHISSLSDYTTNTKLPTLNEATTIVKDSLPDVLQKLTI
jgi:hypothetical protein